jgi:hypothetical protein
VAPESQILSLKLAYLYIASGNYLDAAHILDNAAKETVGDFSCGCSELSNYCYQCLGAERITDMVS